MKNYLYRRKPLQQLSLNRYNALSFYTKNNLCFLKAETSQKYQSVSLFNDFKNVEWFEPFNTSPSVITVRTIY
jgi:hypothetical protein